MRCANKQGLRKQVGGFTLFEMVVVICSIVILYMVAEQRLNDLPAAAERANFNAILQQVKTGINFEMYAKLASGELETLKEKEGTNPMAVLLETPSNYLGELVEVTDTSIDKRGVWYFETMTGELVYVVGGASIDDVWISFGDTEVNYGQIRFRLQNRYRNDGINETGNEETSISPLADRGKWDAILLEPVRPYRWERQSEQPIEI